MASQAPFETSDLALATALLCEGHPLQTARRDERGRVVFAFRATAELERAKLRHLNGESEAARVLAVRNRLLDLAKAGV